MQKRSSGASQCPVARSLEHVGESWSMLILRDAFHGLTRFDEFQKSLGIAPNMLTARLASLVESGLLERRLYCDRPPRYEYVLTERGRDFRPVVLALMAWGNRHFAPEGEAIRLVDRTTGEPLEPVLVHRGTDRILDEDNSALAAGPAAGPDLRARIAFAAQRSSTKPRSTPN